MIARMIIIPELSYISRTWIKVLVNELITYNFLGFIDYTLGLTSEKYQMKWESGHNMSTEVSNLPPKEGYGQNGYG